MRCPKCNYISFDYNPVCPKCHKDLQEVRSRLNLPDFEPAPPSLLGVLLGGVDDSNVNLDGLPAHMDAIEHEDGNIEVSDDDLLAEEPAMDGDEQDLEISFGLDESESAEEINEPETTLGFPEMDVGEGGSGEIVVEPLADDDSGRGEELSLDLDGVSVEADDQGLSSVDAALAEGQATGLNIEVEGLSPAEEPAEKREMEDQPLDLELEGIAFDMEDIEPEVELVDQETLPESTEEQDPDDFLLDLDDLTINGPETPSPNGVEETPYEESELVTMEIDRKKMGMPEDEENSGNEE